MKHHFTRCLSRSRHRIRHSAAMCREWRWLNKKPVVQHHPARRVKLLKRSRNGTEMGCLPPGFSTAPKDHSPCSAP